MALTATAVVATADFSPTNLPGLVFWLDAADVLGGENPGEGSAIGLWRDKSGGGQDVVQMNSTYRPHYITNGITRADGQTGPVVRFDLDWMETEAIRPETGTVHAFVLSQRSAAQLGGDTYQRLLSTSDGNDGYDWKIPDWVIISDYDSSGISLEYGPYVDSRLMVDGVDIASLSVGRNAETGGSRFRGDIAEVLIFTNQLAGSNLSELLDYLDEKWISGFPSGPYFRLISATQDGGSPSIDLSATLKGTHADVSVCWDLSDQGTNLLAWGNTQGYTNLPPDTLITTSVTNLNLEATYWYRFFATSQLIGAFNWSEPYPFTVNRGPVGAIRWDAWVGDLSSPGLQVERNLSPPYYQNRVAFYGEILSSTQILARATTQAVIDKEIAFAHAAGLDFWAYVLYDDALATARLLHQSSLYKMDMKFCVIHEGARAGSGGLAAWPARIQRYIDFFKEPNYQTVLNGRPLFFVLSPGAMVGANKFSSVAEAATALAQLRDAVVNEGMPSPYLVAMEFDPSVGADHVVNLGFDAISSYAIGGNAVGAEPYSNLRASAEGWWDSAKATGAKVVPPVTSGWDRRPRIENPVSWEPWQLPGVGISNYYERPTPQELGAHLQAARDWCSVNATAAEADALIIYAWNENDEGGWIVPTLSEQADHLEAIQGVLNVDPDPDGDRMPDLWETWYFDSPLNASSITDHDSDGALDFHEYTGGTDPAVAGSLFALVPSSAGGFKWDGKAGRSYSVRHAPQLTPANWSVVTNISVRSTNQIIELSMPLSLTSGFYRVEVAYP